MATLEGSPFYVDFVCNITREMIKPFKLEEARKLEAVLNARINDLVKSSKGKTKGKNKHKTLNSGAGKGTSADTSRYDDNDYDDMEDLM